MFRNETVVVRLPARLDSIRSLSDLVDDLARKARLDDHSVFHCRLAIDEALANIIEHAYPDRRDGEIEAVIKAEEGACTIHLIDYGEPYDPTRIPRPHRARSVHDVRPGGLGLHLMRSVMDEVSYQPGPQGNCLKMVKHQPSSD